MPTFFYARILFFCYTVNPVCA